MRVHSASVFARLLQTLRPAHLGTQGRVVGALLLILLGVLVLAGQQALQIARQDADAALRVQATAQLAALSQAVADSAILRDYNALQAQLKTPIAQGNLQYVEYTTPRGFVLREEAPAHHAHRPSWFAALTGLTIPVMREALVIGDTYYGQLKIQPSAHAYEDFLWHLGSRLLLLLAAAFALLGWLTHVLLRINLQDLTRLRATARQIEAGDYSLRLPIRASSPPELRETTHAFNHMSAALERLLSDLGEQQKALDSTASVSESDLAGTITFANELFCKLSGYTR
jgi:methyl-accepting chemotaxis protein